MRSAVRAVAGPLLLLQLLVNAVYTHLPDDADLALADVVRERPPAPRPGRRQNDRMSPGAVDNFPTVYQRLLLRARSPSAAGSLPTGGGHGAARRWISAVRPDGLLVGAEEPQPPAAAGTRVVLPAAARWQLSKKDKLREKIAKFLNLFTVVQFPNDACESPGVGLTGTCYHHLQCRSLGGHPGGACAQGYGVCCLFEKTCGGTTRHNSTYFVSSPSAEVGPAADGYFNCFLTVEKIGPEVTQLRLDFLHFELAAPTDGTCAEERFVIVSPDRNAPTPALCGTNTGQHMYVQVGGAGGAVRLGVQWRSPAAAPAAPAAAPAPAPAPGGRRWVVRLTQLRAREEGAAPPGCLQYHTGHAGRLQSFGYLSGSYTNNLNYAVCIRKEAGFCSVTYSTETSNGTTAPFQLLNEDQDGAPTIPPGQAGAEVLNCPSDYIVLNGIRLCGERLNDASVDPDYTHNSPVTDSGSGPFVLPVRTNGNLTGRGFSLAYRQLACTDAPA
ncbi:Phosphate-binding protein [Frankliniella fusca]|uniref:Phosphate-binding protein n=1 Tax=Frankliniella fusca TaxID=407009 RepID=A0AAE1HFB4_9NEOP|nr:Phosphate-binding protein [Frankliniella fusca]